jgi:hypothetical protein
VLGLNDPEIHLLNYERKSWELQKISFDDWTIRFCYSFLLGYKIQEKINTEKEFLIDGEPGYLVNLKNKRSVNVLGKILYDKNNNRFQGFILD